MYTLVLSTFVLSTYATVLITQRSCVFTYIYILHNIYYIYILIIYRERERSEAFTPSYSFGVGALERTPMQTCDFSIITSWLSLDLYISVGVFLRVCSVRLEHLSVGLLLGDSFCKIITCHYCFFCKYYFNVVHGFYVIKNSSNCDVFYGIKLLKSI